MKKLVNVEVRIYTCKGTEFGLSLCQDNGYPDSGISWISLVNGRIPQIDDARFLPYPLNSSFINYPTNRFYLAWTQKSS
jgi:hypothetical protein